MTAIPLSRARILLVISGGIAAYKSLELIRASERARRDGSRRDDRGRQAIHYPSFGRDAQRAARARRPVQPDRRSGDRPYRIVASRRPPRGRAGHRQSPRPHGRRSRRRPGDDAAARDRQARAGRPSDERQDVAAPRDPAQRRSAQRRRRSVRRSRTGSMACGEFGPGRMAEPPAIVEAIEQALAAGTALGDLAAGRSAQRTAHHSHLGPDL